MSTDKLIEESRTYLMNTYNRYPVVFVRGRGMKLYDSDGKEYIDFLGGIAVNNLGHCHPKVVVALQKQAQKLMHVSNYFHIEPQIKLGKMLCQNSFLLRLVSLSRLRISRALSTSTPAGPFSLISPRTSNTRSTIESTLSGDVPNVTYIWYSGTG